MDRSQGEEKNYAGAEELFRKALSVNPSYKEALYGLGMVYGYQNQYEIAHGYLSKALDLDPGFLTAWKWRGIVSYEMKNFEDAISDFSEVGVRSIERRPVCEEGSSFGID